MLINVTKEELKILYDSLLDYGNDITELAIEHKPFMDYALTCHKLARKLQEELAYYEED